MLLKVNGKGYKTSAEKLEVIKSSIKEVCIRLSYVARCNYKNNHLSLDIRDISGDGSRLFISLHGLGKVNWGGEINICDLDAEVGTGFTSVYADMIKALANSSLLASEVEAELQCGILSSISIETEEN